MSRHKSDGIWAERNKIRKLLLRHPLSSPTLSLHQRDPYYGCCRTTELDAEYHRSLPFLCFELFSVEKRGSLAQSAEIFHVASLEGSSLPDHKRTLYTTFPGLFSFFCHDRRDRLSCLMTVAWLGNSDDKIALQSRASTRFAFTPHHDETASRFRADGSSADSCTKAKASSNG